MIGTATRLQATVCEQPSEAFSAAVKMSKLALPVPSSPVTPKVSLLGCAAPPVSSDSGGSPAQASAPPLKTVPSAATNGTQCCTCADSSPAHDAGSGDGAPTTAGSGVAPAYWSSR